MLRHVDLCSGIGGFSLGFEWAELSTPILFCDTEEWCRKILAKNFPNVPIATDVKELANDPERLVPSHDILTAGYPCQPFSVAGKQRGVEDDRHIWPYILRIVAHKRPTWCVFENVHGHIALGLDQVLLDLEAEGYSTRTFIVPAAGVNAPHRRDRLWIIAHSNSDSQSDVTEHGGQRQGELGQDKELAHPDGIGRGGGDSTRRGVGERDVQSEEQGRSSVGREAERRGEPRREDVAHSDSSGQQQGDKEMEGGLPEQLDSGSIQSREDVGNSSGTRLEGANNHEKSSERLQQEFTQRSQAMAYSSGSELKGSREKQIHGQSDVQEQFGRGSKNQHGEWAVKSKLGRMGDGLSTRLDGFGGWEVEPEDIPRVVIGMKGRANRLKGLGNAIVPQIAMNIGLAIKEQIK